MVNPRIQAPSAKVSKDHVEQFTRPRGHKVTGSGASKIQILNAPGTWFPYTLRSTSPDKSEKKAEDQSGLKGNCWRKIRYNLHHTWVFAAFESAPAFCHFDPLNTGLSPGRFTFWSKDSFPFFWEFEP